MPAPSALRLQIEHALESRFPAALTPSPRTTCEVASTGIEEADRLLEGGLPVGAISEITGPVSSGRTSLVLAYLAQRTAEERVCAWVDTTDAFDPESAAANGVLLRQLLWVRCNNKKPNFNRPSLCSMGPNRQSDKPWNRLDQALRATDLLLQTAGFAAIVLDLGDIAPQHAGRIPLATWFRYRQAADRTRCSLLVIRPRSRLCACPARRLPLVRAAGTGNRHPTDEDQSVGKPAGSTVLRGLTYNLESCIQRISSISIVARKPPVSTWSAGAHWETERVPQARGPHGRVFVRGVEDSILRPGSGKERA